MLSLIPAILLLAFQGPSALERLGHEGRLPSALKALERALTAQSARAEANRETRPGGVSAGSTQRALAQLAALTSDPAFTAAIVQYLEGAAPADLPSPPLTVRGPDADPETLVLAPPNPARPSEGFRQSQRSRDGPH